MQLYYTSSLPRNLCEELHCGGDAEDLPTYLLYEQALPYPWEHLIQDYSQADADDREGALAFLLYECFTPTEVSEVAHARVTNPFPDDWGVHLCTEQVTFPLPKTIIPRTWGPYNPHESLWLEITETVWGVYLLGV